MNTIYIITKIKNFVTCIHIFIQFHMNNLIGFSYAVFTSLKIKIFYLFKKYLFRFVWQYATHFIHEHYVNSALFANYV